jgi:hypothetical protein
MDCPINRTFLPGKISMIPPHPLSLLDQKTANIELNSKLYHLLLFPSREVEK